MVLPNALLHVKLIKCYGLHPWSSLISPLINTTVTSLFPIQHRTHFLTDYYMWYLVPFYSFSTDMHEETNVSFSPVIRYDYKAHDEHNLYNAKVWNSIVKFAFSFNISTNEYFCLLTSVMNAFSYTPDWKFTSNTTVMKIQLEIRNSTPIKPCCGFYFEVLLWRLS